MDRISSMRNQLLHSFFLILTIVFLSAPLYGEKKEITIPVKNKTISIEKPDESTVLGISEKELKEPRCEEQSSFDARTFFFSGILVAATFVALLFVLMLLKEKLMSDRRELMKKFEKHMVPLKQEIAKKEEEMKILRETLLEMEQYREEASEKDKFKERLKAKEEENIELLNEIAALKESMSSNGVTEDVIKLEKQIITMKEEIETLSKEKLEFLEMIESLQKKNEKQPEGLVEEAEPEVGALSQDQLDSLLSETASGGKRQKANPSYPRTILMHSCQRRLLLPRLQSRQESPQLPCPRMIWMRS